MFTDTSCLPDIQASATGVLLGQTQNFLQHIDASLRSGSWKSLACDGFFIRILWLWEVGFSSMMQHVWNRCTRIINASGWTDAYQQFPRMQSLTFHLMADWQNTIIHVWYILLATDALLQVTHPCLLLVILFRLVQTLEEGTSDTIFIVIIVVHRAWAKLEFGT